MADVRNFYPILCKLKVEIWDEIKSIFVFGIKGRDVLVIKHDDTVHAYGDNFKGCLGLGHEKRLKSKLEKLSSLNDLRKISYGLQHIMFLSNGGQVHCWGKNHVGQLGINSKERQIIPNFIDECRETEDISCGSRHSLVLTKAGDIFAWGDNSYGQLGDGTFVCKYIPVNVVGLKGKKVMSISAGENHSLALSEDGSVWSWGSNVDGQLGFELHDNSQSCNKPKKVQINSKVIKVACGKFHSLFLSEDGIIFGSGRNESGQLGLGDENKRFVPTQLKTSLRFINMETWIHSDISVALSNDKKYYYWGKCFEDHINSPTISNLKYFHEIFANFSKIKITHKPLILTEEINSEMKSWKGNFEVVKINLDCMKIKMNSDAHSSSQNDNRDSKIIVPSINGKFKNDFIDLKEIGRGSYGFVFKATHEKNQNKIFAIKVIKTIPNLCKYAYREIQILSTISSKFATEYITAWTEDFRYNPEIRHENIQTAGESSDLQIKDKAIFLFIQMEYCCGSLSKFLKDIDNELDQDEDELLTPIGFFVAGELLFEILESVNYLHKHNPPIIHRDLSLYNILTSAGSNGRFIKLGDFGLAKYHDLKTHENTKDIGNVSYMAPEMAYGRYDTKVDIYSVGIIITKLFKIDVTEELVITEKNRIFANQLIEIMKISKQMRKDLKRMRPDCDQVSKDEKLWKLTLDCLLNDDDCNRIINSIRRKTSADLQLHEYFLKIKMEMRE